MREKGLGFVIAGAEWFTGEGGGNSEGGVGWGTEREEDCRGYGAGGGNNGGGWGAGTKEGR